MAAVLATSACSPVLPAPPDSGPASSTPDLAATGLIQTLTAAPSLTPSPQKTSTVTLTALPSNTLLPTITSIPSLTPIPSLTKAGEGGITSTPSGDQTGTPTGDYACEFISKSPANWTILKPRAAFDGSWKVKNTGTKPWNVGQISLVYTDGTKFQEDKNKKTYGLDADVKTGDSVDLIVDMITPKLDGYYSANWGLMVNATKITFCNLTIKIIVQK